MHSGREAISGRWVEKWKVKQHKEVFRGRSVFVIKALMQVGGMDCIHRSAPTLSASAICLLTGVGIREDINIGHLDIQLALVQASLKEEVHMKLSPQFVHLIGKIVKVEQVVVQFEGSPTCIPQVADG